LSAPINLTFLLGVSFIFIAGFATWKNAVIVPILGALADTLGIGAALAVLGAVAFLFYFRVRVHHKFKVESEL
jgi:hypothetical protein